MYESGLTENLVIHRR